MVALINHLLTYLLTKTVLTVYQLLPDMHTTVCYCGLCMLLVSVCQCLLVDAVADSSGNMGQHCNMVRLLSCVRSCLANF